MTSGLLDPLAAAAGLGSDRGRSRTQLGTVHDGQSERRLPRVGHHRHQRRKRRLAVQGVSRYVATGCYTSLCEIFNVTTGCYASLCELFNHCYGLLRRDMLIKVQRHACVRAGHLRMVMLQYDFS